MHDGNHAVRTERWRSIHYANGGEELYDEPADPHEWVNLAGQAGLASVKAELAKWIPAESKAAPGDHEKWCKRAKKQAKLRKKAN